MYRLAHGARFFSIPCLVGRPPLLQPWPTQTSRAGYGSRALQTQKKYTYDADPKNFILNRVIYLSDF